MFLDQSRVKVECGGVRLAGKMRKMKENFSRKMRKKGDIILVPRKKIEQK